MASSAEQEAEENAWRGLQLLNAAKRLEADGDHDAAEQSYAHALDRVAHPDVLAAFGNFLQTVRGEYDRAEAMFKQSLQSDPTHLDTLQFYAIFLEEVRGDLDAAERLYTVALESTRDGLLNDIETPKAYDTDARTENNFHNGIPQFLPASLAHDFSKELQPPAPNRAKKSANKISKRGIEQRSDEVRLKQSPKRETLRQQLQHGRWEKKSPGSRFIRPSALYDLMRVDLNETSETAAYTCRFFAGPRGRRAEVHGRKLLYCR
jgi:tetratricopeptide (TPR) repeat protein